MLEYACEARDMVHGRTRSDLDSDRMLELCLARLLEILVKPRIVSLPACTVALTQSPGKISLAFETD